jgi:hypothetical protein
MSIDLSLFLRNIADMLDSNKLNNKELKLIGEFYMSYKFQNTVIDKLDNEDLKDLEESDFIKFLILGWYIYCVILKDENYLKLQDQIKENIDYEKNLQNVNLTEDKKRCR